MHRILLALAVALVAVPLSADAQEWQVARERFAFVGTRLDIQVDIQAPGTLRLIRGQAGTVNVAGRSHSGFTSSGLADGDRLTLTGTGAGPVDFLVAVPENAWVEISLPDRALSLGVARGESGTWEWNADQRSHQAPVTEWVPGMGADPVGDAYLYTTFTRDRAPAEIQLPDLDAVRRVTVRVQGQRFKVITSRPLGVHEGATDHIVIRPAGPPMDVVLAIPTFTADFTLLLGGQTALVLDGPSVQTLCTPVTRQRLSHDRLWFTFNPLDGGLRCGDRHIQRHGG